MQRLIILFVFGLAFLSSISSQAETSKSLPKFAKLKTFTLRNIEGEVFTAGHIVGKITVVNFFFTSCKKICPLTMRNIAIFQQKLAKDLEFEIISVSVDPKRDTKAKLNSFAQKIGAVRDNWQFLRGERSEIGRLLTEELSLADGETPDFHTTRITLLDPELNIRGYYDALSSKDLAQLRKDVHTLSKQAS
ncbi:MAG: SCO family protein [Bdellovibrionota bacterium]